MTTKSNNGSYLSKRYDEKQLLDRYKISFETMVLMALLIFISGMIKIFHGQWAAPNTEMIILLSIPLTYFTIRSVLKGAYFTSYDEKYRWLVIILFLATGLLNIGTSLIQIMTGGSIIDNNGMFSENLFQFFLGIPLLAVSVASLIKGKTDKGEE